MLEAKLTLLELIPAKYHNGVEGQLQHGGDQQGTGTQGKLTILANESAIEVTFIEPGRGKNSFTYTFWEGSLNGFEVAGGFYFKGEDINRKQRSFTFYEGE